MDFAKPYTTGFKVDGQEESVSEAFHHYVHQRWHLIRKEMGGCLLSCCFQR